MAGDQRPIWCPLSVISGTTPHSGQSTQKVTLQGLGALRLEDHKTSLKATGDFMCTGTICYVGHRLGGLNMSALLISSQMSERYQLA